MKKFFCFDNTLLCFVIFTQGTPWLNEAPYKIGGIFP